MINIKGHIKLDFAYKFAEIPQLGKIEKWKPIVEIEKNNVCWLKTQTNYDVCFGIGKSILITSNPIVKENYIEFDFVDYMP